MKKNYWLGTLLLLPMAVACGNKQDGNASGSDTLAQQTASQAAGPVADETSTQEFTAKIGKHDYHIELKQYADKTLPVVQDEFGGQSYDNSIEMTIKRDGSIFKSKKITKEAFQDFLSETDRKISILQGMTFVKADAQGLHFAAQVGERDTDGASAFKVMVNTNGTIDITRDYNQDTTGSDSE